MEKFSDDDEIFITKSNRENEFGREVHDEETTRMPGDSTHYATTGNKDDLQVSQLHELQQAYVTTFQFSVLQYEKGR